MSNRDKRCLRCKCYRYPEDFIKNGRILKTCSTCRASAAKYRNRYICPHGIQKYFCKACIGSQICEHEIQKRTCKGCKGYLICVHEIQKNGCKICSDPIKVTIVGWLSNSKIEDRKHNRYDPDRFIDKCFLRGLIEDSGNRCRYCEKKIQYTKYTDDLATIERLDNKIGHIKSNCVIACLQCNLRHKD